jgi:hypothetical protein
MITFEEAKHIAKTHLKGSTIVAVKEEGIVEKSFGWYFPIKSKTGELIIGSKGFIVDREDGHVFTLGSSFTPKRDFAACEAGFRYDFYDLTILTVQNISKTVLLGLYSLLQIFLMIMNWSISPYLLMFILGVSATILAHTRGTRLQFMFYQAVLRNALNYGSSIEEVLYASRRITTQKATEVDRRPEMDFE